MSKEIKSSSMDRLFGHLTSTGTEPVQVEAAMTERDEQQAGDAQENTAPSAATDGEKKNQKRRKSSTERLCTYIDYEVMGKIRSISEIENVSLKDIINYSLKMSIANYETYHGKLRVRRQKKGDIDNVFHK
ncbi:MAG: hypothetical protein PUF37_00780 [Prevotellaceae bacterium]|nr:hypothetical protein [Prevotellaceae bacterium]